MVVRLSRSWWCVAVVVVVVTVMLTGEAGAQKNLARPVHTTQYPPRPDRTNAVTVASNKRYGGSPHNDVRRYGAAPSANGHSAVNGANGYPAVNGANGYPGVNGHNLHDGHRMITRALWRIFDALMQKKDHSQLYGRVNFVEEALKKMITVDSQLEGEIDKLKEEMHMCRTQLSAVLGEVSRVKSLSSRLEALEAANPELRQQGDQEHVWGAMAAYTSCPPPFSRVGAECFFVSVEEMLGWDDARRECGRLGGDLASPRDLPTLRDFLTGVQEPPEYLWVGGTMQEDGAWVWTSGPQAGVHLDMSKDTWNEEVPSGSGRCMGLFGQSSYRAYNYDCNEKDFFVCQYHF